MTQHSDAADAGDAAAPASAPVPESSPGTDPGASPRVIAPRQVTLRRAPRYRAFVITGVVAGVLIALVLTRLFPDNGNFSARAVFGYLAVSLGLLGGLLGAAVAVVLEGRH